jgi:hypothetical protein
VNGFACERSDLRLKQREHEELIGLQFDDLGVGIVGRRLDDHVTVDQAL